MYQLSGAEIYVKTIVYKIQAKYKFLFYSTIDNLSPRDKTVFSSAAPFLVFFKS